MRAVSISSPAPARANNTLVARLVKVDLWADGDLMFLTGMVAMSHFEAENLATIGRAFCKWRVQLTIRKQ